MKDSSNGGSDEKPKFSKGRGNSSGYAGKSRDGEERRSSSSFEERGTFKFNKRSPGKSNSEGFESGERNKASRFEGKKDFKSGRKNYDKKDQDNFDKPSARGDFKQGRKSYGKSESDGYEKPERKSGDSFNGNKELKPGRKSFSKKEGFDQPFERGEKTSRPGFNKSGSDGFEKSSKKPYGKSGSNRFEKSEKSNFDTSEGGDFERNEKKSFSKSNNRYSKEGSKSFSKSSNKPGKTKAFREDDNFSLTPTPTKSSAYTKPKRESEDDGQIRLNKYISNSGICSRREADELISAGAVKVNGKIVTELGYKVMPGDKVNYGGQTLNKEKKVYLLLNKPKDYITTTDDPEKRKTVMELLKGACKERIYPVGRLDRATTGLLLFTNDGDMAKRLTHPSHGAKKLYHVYLDNPLKKVDFDKIANGLILEDGPIQVDQIVYAGDTGDKRELGVELHSGKNRIVRRIFESLGYEVVKLDRVIFAGLTKKDLPRGRYRFLTEKEINLLNMQKK
ncbi:MAG: rRNA pseudouridine synthase [Bacteroidia bacterium]|nr:rRNA pseudouridine synthase [Bacteroidia bacterium]